jgi:hypothetical protein
MNLSKNFRETSTPKKLAALAGIEILLAKKRKEAVAQTNQGKHGASRVGDP